LSRIIMSGLLLGMIILLLLLLLLLPLHKKEVNTNELCDKKVKNAEHQNHVCSIPAGPCGIRGGQSDNGTDFSRRTPVFSLSASFHYCSILIHSSVPHTKRFILVHEKVVTERLM
jgi:hypothetical protein